MQVLANFSCATVLTAHVRYPLRLKVVRAVNLTGPVQLRQLVITTFEQLAMTF
jgi:hypothetical protein